MTKLTINLSKEATNDFAAFYGWTPQIEQSVEQTDEAGNSTTRTETVANPVSAQDFATQKLIERIQNDLTERRNRKAIAAANAQPMPEITAGV